MQKMQVNINQLGALFCSIFFLSTEQVFSETVPLLNSPEVENPKSILFIGNSFFYYNNGVHKPLLGMVRANESLGKGHRFRNITINSSSLEWHDVESYVTNERIGSFSITSKNKYKKYDPEKYDLAIMMDCSQCPIHEDRKELFNFYVDAHSKTLRDNGVEPSLLMTWAYKDKPEMIDGLAASYISAANRNKAMVFPVGLAFQLSQAEYPAIDLFTLDKRHPSKAGTYLMASVIYSSVYNVSPIGNSYDYGLDQKTQDTLQKMAWKALKNYKNIK
ncbi:hypothetical protein N9T78_03400 [Gammaproteobacteria bacterium]|nr:hypothetical protein [Gammaproteobacteria bacterium]